jgi:endonuclease G
MVAILSLLAFTALAIPLSKNDTTIQGKPSISKSDIVLTYNYFELEFNCKERTADRWTYTLEYDNGSAKRPSSFYNDPNLSRDCQQFTTSSYGRGYDRGHLVTSNHMDYDDFGIRESHYMTNIVPQVSSFNQGIWQTTEQITDCYRDIEPITVYGGVIYTDSSNDYFVNSHGIKTPDYFWKVLLTRDQKGSDMILSWLFPNEENLGRLDSYIVSVREIEDQLNDGLGPIPVPNRLKDFRARSSWTIPENCDKS